MYRVRIPMASPNAILMYYAITESGASSGIQEKAWTTDNLMSANAIAHTVGGVVEEVDLESQESDRDISN